MHKCEIVLEELYNIKEDLIDDLAEVNFDKNIDADKEILKKLYAINSQITRANKVKMK